MHRIYIPPENISDTEVVFQAEQAHRIRTVLRLRIGDAFVVFDGTGKEYRVKLGRITNREGTATIESITAINRDPKLGMTLLQGIPKSDKMDFIVQKTTELGVKQIIPIITERTIPNFTLQKAQERVIRWRKIAIAAAEQSGRTVLPAITPIVGLIEGLEKTTPFDLRLFLWEEERSTSLKSVLRKIDSISSAAVVIGPEGGFTQAEAELAREYGSTIVTLGTRLLRTETAPIAALSILLYEFAEE